MDQGKGKQTKVVVGGLISAGHQQNHHLLLGLSERTIPDDFPSYSWLSELATFKTDQPSSLLVPGDQDEQVCQRVHHVRGCAVARRRNSRFSWVNTGLFIEAEFGTKPKQEKLVWGHG